MDVDIDSDTLIWDVVVMGAAGPVNGGVVYRDAAAVVPFGLGCR